MYSKIFTKNMILVAGIDESGCGSLVGPVIAAAVMFNALEYKLISGVADSKVLSEKKRLSLYQDIKKQSLTWSIGFANVEEIDRLNILKARLLAIQRAILNLLIVPDLVLIDGIHAPNLKHIHYKCLVQGDKTVPIISAASIVAKVKRDHNMKILDGLYPKYGFIHNKGYPTCFHLKQLALLGPTIHHRKSFAPVKRYII